MKFRLYIDNKSDKLIDYKSSNRGISTETE